MGLFDPGLSKEEKELLLNRISQIEAKISTLKAGSQEEIKSEFSGLVAAIESRIPPEEKEIISLRDTILECVNGAKDAADFVESKKKKIEDEAKIIEERVQTVNSISDESISKSKTLKNILDQATSHLDEISKSKTDLTSITQEVERLSLVSEASKKRIVEFESSVDTVEDAKSKIVLTQKNTRDLLNEVKSLHTKIFGKDDINEETGKHELIEGLASRLETAYSETESGLSTLRSHLEDLKKSSQVEYSSIKEAWNSEYGILKEKIEGLLPGALSAGLSQAYEEKKNTEIQEMYKSNKAFYWSIGFLTIFASLSVGFYIWLLVFENKTLEDVAKLSPSVFLTLLPLYLPSLWVAFSSAKKAKLSKRLAEEYAHKSSLSKTFEGISRQVSRLSDSELSANLESKLLYILIQVSSENPGKLISDYNKADHPLHEVLDKSVEFAESLEKLSFVPGIDKIISLVHKKNQKSREKVADALEVKEGTA
jgi:methyl-accepting chemotaxis protein